MKLEVPRFDGTDATGWIFKATQYFDSHGTSDAYRLQVASFYMDGPALSWFQWMFKNKQISTWSRFLTAIEMRFAPSFYDDPKGALFKLTQQDLVAQYLSDFKSLANRVVGLPAPFLLSYFVSGLSSAIRREVQALQPLTLLQAASLARLQEDKLNDRRPFRPLPSSLPIPATPISSIPATTTTNPSPPLPPAPPKPSFKCLTPTEIEARRVKGLCYNCDERYSRGHRCKSKFFLIIADDHEETILDDSPPLPSSEDIPTNPDDSGPSEATISFNALSGLGFCSWQRGSGTDRWGEYPKLYPGHHGPIPQSENSAHYSAPCDGGKWTRALLLSGMQGNPCCS